MKHAFIYGLLFFLLSLSMLSAIGTGKLMGKVTDMEGNSIEFAKVVLRGTEHGAEANEKGVYIINKIPVGTYDVDCFAMGYSKETIKDVKINLDLTTTQNFKLQRQYIEMSEACCIAASALSVSDAADGRSALQYRSQDMFYSDFSTEEYSPIKENDYFEALKDPMSTFGADVDAASYGNFRRFIMENQLPYADVIRTEEMINYFDYEYKHPEGEDPLSINIEYGDCPWNEKHNLVHIGLKGKTLKKEEQKQSNLVFLIDVSGSMASENKLPLLKRSFKLMVDNLADDDRISVVVYAGSAGMVLPPTKGSEKKTIMDALDKLNAGGSTAGGAGIMLAYKTASENFIRDGNNRVILATDGDFNVGISSTSELVKFVEEKKNEGIFLTILGFGMGNYKDDRLQQIADKGNGNHYYIDNIMEAKKVLVNELTGTLFTIAKDSKIQVEFNPVHISRYRLIGYENRMLENKDFEDDTKDAGEIGSGHTVTAIYEVVPANRDSLLKAHQSKYIESKIKDEYLNSDEIMTVRIRYKEPDGEKSKEFSKVLKNKPLKLDNTSDNFRFSAAVVELSQILRDSPFKGKSNIEEVIKLAKAAKGKDENGYRAEFIDLCERSAILLKERK